MCQKDGKLLQHNKRMYHLIKIEIGMLHFIISDDFVSQISYVKNLLHDGTTSHFE